MPTPTPPEWFEMPELRRRRFADAVWIPLRISETTVYSGAYGKPGNKEETLLAGCVAVPLAHRTEAEKLGWMDIGLTHSGGPYAFEDGRYKPADVYQYRDGEDLATDLVFDQSFDGVCPRIWHVNQDLVLALGLLQEGDAWLRPSEGFIEVMRQRRNGNGDVIAIEIKSEFLRDYLAARGMILRLYYYCRRMEVISDVAHIPWTATGITDEKEHDSFKARMWEVDQDGDQYGAGVALFQVWRTDVDNEEDVPKFGPETDDNTAYQSTSFVRQGEKFHRVEGELWRGEWIEPSPRSERIRGDAPAQYHTYVVDAQGTRETGDKLNDEDIGCYLWFDPKVIMALSGRRGGGLKWYTAQTGSVWSLESWPTHFGINSTGLINVYAYDVAKLPSWQQQIWAAHNVTPNGSPSTELLDAQMRTRPAKTTAPEDDLRKVMELLDAEVEARFGDKLFKPHAALDGIFLNIQRFRALDEIGLLALAKDLARVTVDLLNIGFLKTVGKVADGEKLGSLKLLERFLSLMIGEQRAQALMTPLFGIYELRLADAHLPSSELEPSFAKVGLDRTAPGIFQGQQLIARVTSVLVAVYRLVRPASES